VESNRRSKPRILRGGLNVNDPKAPEIRAKWEKWVRQVEGTWGPGNFSTLFRYLDKKGDVLSGEFVAYLRQKGLGEMGEELEQNRREGVETLARGLARNWKLHDPSFRNRLAECAEVSGLTPEDQKWHLAQEGFLLAVADMDRVQTIRLGKKWVKDETGRKALLAPSDLVWRELERWLANASRKAAEAVLGDGPWPPGDSEPELTRLQDDDLLLEDVTMGPLERLLLDEDCRFLEELIESAELSPALASLVDTFRSVGSWSETGRILKLNPSTRRKRKKALLAKLRPT